MKVVFQTRLTPAVTIFDSQESGSAIADAVRKSLDPVVAVTDDAGNVIYQSGDFYQSWFPFIAAGVGIVIALLIIRGRG